MQRVRRAQTCSGDRIAGAEGDEAANEAKEANEKDQLHHRLRTGP
jgi:hypothetical protein